MLQIRTVNGVSPKGLLLYDRWLRDRVHSGVTIDQIVQELIPANGGTFDNPATSYYQTETSPQLLAENMAQAFLGTRIQCAQCHNHPFDKWTMDDYYGFAAFFSQIGYKQAQDPREIMIFNAATGSLKHPVDDRPVVPTYLGAGRAELPAGADNRQVLAEWLASNQNPAFAKNLSNIMWAHFFGVAAQVMRRILVDHARRHGAHKRGQGVRCVSIDEATDVAAPNEIPILALDHALDRLDKVDADLTRIVELRAFGGLTIEEAAHVLGVSPSTAKRDWRTAKAWLTRELGPVVRS